MTFFLTFFYHLNVILFKLSEARSCNTKSNALHINTALLYLSKKTPQFDKEHGFGRESSTPCWNVKSNYCADDKDKERCKWRKEEEKKRRRKLTKKTILLFLLFFFKPLSVIFIHSFVLLTHSFIHHLFIHSFIQTPLHLFIYLSFLHPFIHSIVSYNHVLIHSSTLTFIYSTFHLFIHPSNHSFIHSSIHSLIHPPIHSFIYPFINSSIYPFIHPPTHSFIYPFIHSLIYKFKIAFLLTLL